MNVHMHRAALGCAIVLASACAVSTGTMQASTTARTETENQAKAPERTAPLLEGMGNLHWAISTQSELACGGKGGVDQARVDRS